MHTKLKTGISLLLILILTIGMSVPVLAQSSITNIIPTLIGKDDDVKNYVSCDPYKIEFNEKNGDGTYSFNEGRYDFTVTRHDTDDGQLIDWSSNVRVSYVYVKGGSEGGNLFEYSPPSYEDKGLYAPVNPSGKFADVSHITFYICPEEPAPSIDIEKWVSVDGGDTWHDADSATGPVGMYPGSAKFKVVVTNTGNVALTDVVVTDTDFTFTGIASTLAVSTSSTSDILSVDTILGQHSNTATVNAKYDGEAITPDSDMAHYITYEEPAPSIDIEKWVSVDGGDTWHDADSATGPVGMYPGTAKFKVVVTNTGNVALTDVVVTDTDFTFSGIASTLAVSASSTSDVLSVDTILGQHSNTATVNAKYDGEAITPDSDMAHYITYEEPAPSIDIEKWVSVDGGDTWHDADAPTGPTASYPGSVKFKVVVTNKGNVDLTKVLVTDSDFTFTGIPSTLAAKAEVTSDILTVDSILGQHINTAVVEGYYGEWKVSDSDMAHYLTSYEDEPPTISITKTPSPTSFRSRNATVTFTFTITNTCDEQITVTYLHDDVFGDLLTEAESQNGEQEIVLAPKDEPGDDFTFAITRSIYISGDSHTNTITVIAVDEDQNEATDDDDATVYYNPRRDEKDPDISIKKYVSVDGGETWDDAEDSPGPRASRSGTVQFKVVVKNTGDYRLTDIEVTDTDFEFTGISSSLDEGDSDTSDIITVDAVNGQHSNTATVEGFYGSQRVTDSDMAHYYTRDDDTEKGKIKIHKFLDENQNGTQDSGEFHMENVTFELYNADKSEMLSRKQTDNEGNLTFSNLAFGTYQLKEMSEYDITTSGFDSQGFMEIKVDSEATITIIVGNDNDRDRDSDNFEIIEEVVPLALPQTGEMPPTPFYILGALLMLAGMCLKRFE